MAWWQFSVNCPASELDRIESTLLELGAQSLSIADAGDEAIYEPPPGTTPVWSESVVTATFDAALDPESLRQRISEALPAGLASGLRQHELADADWSNAYRDHFRPLECAPGLWIVPDWCQPPEPGALNIRLDPGLAFGTGSHPTTALCLAWLGKARLDGQHVIDYGCGSGILAIAACKLGADRVDAVDIDPQALAATRDNCARNGIAPGRVRALLPTGLDDRPADLLLANILAGALIELAPEFAVRVAPGGQILLSGILISQLDEIQSAFAHTFRLDPPTTREDWAAIAGRRR